MADNRTHIITFDDSPLDTSTKINSEVYNDMLDSLKTSAIRSINRARILNNKLTNFNKALAAENTLLASKFEELSQLSNQVGTEQTSLVTAYDNAVYDTSASSTKNVDLSKLFGQATVKSEKRWSKIPRYTDTAGNRRPSLDTVITLDGVKMASSDDIYNILDGSRDTFWLLDTADGATHTINIQFPPSIKPFVNMFTLAPFPAFGFDLNKVYVTKTDNTVVDITPDGYQAASMHGVESHFASTSWGGSLQINFTARNSVIGMANMDIYLLDYIDDYATVKYEIPAFSTVAMTSIDEINMMDFGIHDILDSEVGYKPLDDLIATVHTTGADQPIDKETLLGNAPTPFVKGSGNKFYISFAFKKHNGQTPIFRSAKVTYS